ncbi:MAG: hypothetical protein ABW152_17285 [Candidatus Thiodiazotropha endolucinida]
MIQSQLESFAQPFFKRRRLKIFLDNASLTMTADLWASIRQMLIASENLILLLSPGSAQSPWVVREAKFFIDHHGIEKVGLVLLDGMTPWTDGENAIRDERCAIAPEVFDIIAGTGCEPLVLDFRKLRNSHGYLRRHDKQFDEYIATISSKLLNIPKDEIFGKHIRALRHRVMSLTALVLGLAVATVTALWFQQLERSALNKATDLLVKTYRIKGVEERDNHDNPLKAAHYFAKAALNTKNKTTYSNVTFEMSQIIQGGELKFIIDGNNDGMIFNKNKTHAVIWHQNGTLRVWDVLSGKPITPILRHENGIGGVIFTPDEARILTWSNDGSVRFWDAVSGALKAVIYVHEKKINNAIFNHDGTRVVTWSEDGSVKIWNSQNGMVTQILKHNMPFRDVIFNYDESRILTRNFSSLNSDHLALLWDSGNGRLISVLGHEKAVLGTKFSEDGNRIVTWSAGNEARVWNSFNGQPVTQNLKHANPGFKVNVTMKNASTSYKLTGNVVKGATFDKKGERLLTWSNEGTTFIWDLNTSKSIKLSMRGTHDIDDAFFSRDGSRVIGWGGFYVYIWNSNNGEDLITTIEKENDIEGFHRTRETERLLIWDNSGKARVWDYMEGIPITPYLKHNAKIVGGFFSRDETVIITWSSDGSIRLWDMRGNMILPPLWHKGAIKGVMLNKDENTLWAWNNSGEIRAWDINLNAGQPTILDHESVIDDVVFNDEKTKMLVLGGYTARLWNIINGKPLTPPLKHVCTIKGGIFRDKSIITWCHDNSIRYWKSDYKNKIYTEIPINPTTFKTVENIFVTRGRDTIKGAMFDRNRERVLMWFDDVLVVLDTRNIKSDGVKSLFVIKHPEVITAKYSKSGEIIISADKYGIVRLWNAKSGTPLLSPLKHGGLYIWFEVKLNRKENKMLTMGSGRREIRLWDIKSGEQISQPLMDETKVFGLEFSKDDKKMLTWGNDGVARLWDSESGKQILPPLKHGRKKIWARFNNDDSKILTWSSNGNVKLWGSLTGELLISTNNLDKNISDAIFNHDESRILTWGRYNTTIRIWDGYTAEQLMSPIKTHSDLSQVYSTPVNQISLNYDESKIVIIKENSQKAYLWPLTPKTKWSKNNISQYLEYKTGTQLNEQGELQTINADDWRNYFQTKNSDPFYLNEGQK